MDKGYNLNRQLQNARDKLHSTLQQVAASSECPPLIMEACNELSTTLEELQVASADLHRQNEELVSIQQTLQLEQQRYHNLFNLAPTGYLVTNSHGVIQQANRAAEGLFGVRQECLVGQPLARYIALEDKPLFYRLLEQTRDVCHRPSPDDQTTEEAQSQPEARILIQTQEIALKPHGQEAFATSLSLTLEYAPGTETNLLWLFQDIRELKQQQAIAQRLAAQEAYIQNERRYQQILNAISDLIFVKDRNSRLVWANQALLDFYGMPLEAIQAIVDTVFTNPDFTRQYLEDDAVVFETGKTLEIPQESITRHDGTVRHFFTVKFPIRNEQGAVTELVGVCRDITDRQQAEMRRRQSEEKFRHFAENSHAIVWMTESNLVNSLYVNPAYEKIWGRSRQSLIDRPDSWLEVVHPDDRGWVEATMGSRLQQNPTTAEYRIIHPDGSIRWIRDQGFAMRNEAGEIYGYGGMAEDITERKQLEFSLRASETQKSQILQSAVASIVSLRVYGNRDFQYDFYSDGCETLYGYSAEELTVNKALWLSRLEPEDRESFLERVFAKIFAGQTFTEELRFHHKNGSVVWISSTHTSQKIAPDCWQVTAVNYDITDRKKAQEALQMQISR
jgi:PAS domain S-box-containing protein